MSMQAIEEIDSYSGVDEPGLLDPNMIPTAATEEVMSGDGIERNFPDEAGGEEDDAYPYAYAYEDDPNDPHHHHPHLEIGDEEVVVTEEVDYGEHWKEEEDKKINLYDVLDGKMFLEEAKPPKRARVDNQPFYGTAGSGGTSSGYGYPPEEEYREYVFSSSKPAPAGDRTCQGCGMTLRRSVFYHHARMIREKGACNLFTPQRFPCNQCDARIGTLEKLCQHMEQIHQSPTQIKTIIFTNEDDFKQFRIELEGKGGNFRMARGNKKNKKGVVQYFRCNRLQTLARAQTFRPVDNPALDELPSNRKRGRLHQQELRAQSAKQVIRTENACTAFYNKAYLANGTIEVRYCDYHLHEDEKLRLPEAVRQRVLELARKNLPHVVILMIVKDERFKYCERNSANDRRIQDMKTQDVRQVLAGNNRAEKTRISRGEAPRDISFGRNHNNSIQHVDDDPSRPWTDVRPAAKVDRCSLTHSELRYLDLFDTNREEIMAKLNERSRLEQDKKMLFDSFIHRLSSSQEVIKHLNYRQLIPSESTLYKLKKAFTYLSKIEDQLLNPRREQSNPVRVTSYIRMMEEEARSIEKSRHSSGMVGGGGGGVGVIGDEIDVVGIDEDDYHNHQMNLHDVVGEEEVSYGDRGEEGVDDLELQRAIEDVEEDDDEYPVVEEVSIEHNVEEVVSEEVVEDAEEPIRDNDEDDNLDKQEEGNGEPTVTRAGRVVKKKTNFD
uniref:C2H2-type domain-containing protein n=2 Tax=Caenorhabditis tropicalis TaxID=1561998 RepID=A0A1I7UUE1_9PELO